MNFGRKHENYGIKQYMSLNLRDNRVCVAAVQQAAGMKPSVRLWFSGEIAENQLSQFLGRLAKKQGLAKYPVTTVLPSRSYQVLVIDPLDIPEEEMETALKWHVQELISKTADQLTVSAITKPKSLDKKQKMSVVVAEDELLMSYIRPMQDVDINLKVIDVEEMAQRNIAGLLAEDVQGVAVVVVGSNHSLITISRQGELYFSRRIMVGETHLRKESDTQNYIDQLLIEVQRSLDFYTANLRQGQLGKVYFSENVESLTELFEQAKKSITARLTVLHMHELFDWGDTSFKWTPIGFYTLGAALRQDNAAA